MFPNLWAVPKEYLKLQKRLLSDNLHQCSNRAVFNCVSRVCWAFVLQVLKYVIG